MSKQYSLFKNPSTAHGGLTRVGKRKIARPLVTKSPIHVVLKSSRALGAWNFQQHAKTINALVMQTAKSKNIRILLSQNVGNHLHLAIQGKKRKQIQDFFRVVTQKIAYAVTKTRKGKPIGKFWDLLVFTRVVNWGRDWVNLQIYFRKNCWGARGIARERVDSIFREVFATGIYSTGGFD